MIENINDIESRNNELLSVLIKKYEIKKTIKELGDAESVFVSIEWDQKSSLESNTLKRAILYANIKYELENGKVIKVNKKEILYNFGKKRIKELKSDDEIELQIMELHIITYLVRQLKSIIRLKYEEGEIETLMTELADVEQRVLNTTTTVETVY